MNMLKTLSVWFAILLFVVWFIVSTYIQYTECDSSDGTLVRGLIGYECIAGKNT